jgi:hypothetical protein
MYLIFCSSFSDFFLSDFEESLRQEPKYVFFIIPQLFSLIGTCIDSEIFILILFQNFQLPPKKSYTLFILMLLSVPSFCWLILSQVSFIIRCLKMLHKLVRGSNFQLCKDTCQTFSGHCHGN